MIGVNGLAVMLGLVFVWERGEERTRGLFARLLRCGVTGANGRRSEGSESEAETERVGLGDAGS